MSKIKAVVISENRKQKLYNDVTEKVMVFRIEMCKTPPKNGVDLDNLLGRLMAEVGEAALTSIQEKL